MKNDAQFKIFSRTNNSRTYMKYLKFYKGVLNSKDEFYNISITYEKIERRVEKALQSKDYRAFLDIKLL